jgi:hypothetical protein
MLIWILLCFGLANAYEELEDYSIAQWQESDGSLDEALISDVEPNEFLFKKLQKP